jgi:hypothetical protein
MPKELTHWMVARLAAAGIDANATPTTAESISKYPDAFLLGAVAYDGPYYIPKDERMAKLGDQLHGKGVADVYAPIKRAVAGVASNPKKPSPAIAFAAGGLTHLAADTIFHPAVFYFTGFASHPNSTVSGSYMFKHRGFEAALDQCLMSTHGSGIERTVSGLFARAAAAPEANALMSALARFYSSDGQAISEEEARGILRRYGKLQRLFFSRGMRLLARLLGSRRAGSNADMSSLFYVRAGRWSNHFAARRRYRHPISGIEDVFEAGDFLRRAVLRSLSLLANLERALDGDASAFPLPGPCLDSGQSIDEDQTMKYCDPALIPIAISGSGA